MIHIQYLFSKSSKREIIGRLNDIGNILPILSGGTGYMFNRY